MAHGRRFERQRRDDNRARAATCACARPGHNRLCASGRCGRARPQRNPLSPRAVVSRRLKWRSFAAERATPARQPRAPAPSMVSIPPPALDSVQRTPTSARLCSAHPSCASGRCSSAGGHHRLCDWVARFQTPAPRGGVPLSCATLAAAATQTSFKPLRLGAVFLCFRGHGARKHRRMVSNPCASGRCSSVWSLCKGEKLWESFKPLRLGAVFLCQRRKPACQGELGVSNPCASGRCSSATGITWRRTRADTFQTPAPRGGVPL